MCNFDFYIFLRTLCLIPGNAIGPEGAVALAAAFKTNQTVHTIDLECMAIFFITNSMTKFASLSKLNERKILSHLNVVVYGGHDDEHSYSSPKFSGFLFLTSITTISVQSWFFSNRSFSPTLVSGTSTLIFGLSPEVLKFPMDIRQIWAIGFHISFPRFRSFENTNSSLRFVALRCNTDNAVGPEGAIAWADALKINKTLHTFVFKGMGTF